MITRCLICNSSVVLTRETAETLLRTLEMRKIFIQGIQHASTEAKTPPSDLHCESPLSHLLQLLQKGLSKIDISEKSTNDFITDVHRFHFLGNDCLCLRCGSKYDNQPLPTS